MTADSKKKSSLGRGLSDLGLSELLGDAAAPAVTTAKTVDLPESNPEDSNGRMRLLAVDQMSPGRYQPRRQFVQQDLQELADSIKAQGMIQPIVVRRKNDAYEIIAGERRWRAAQLIGMPKVPVIIREVADQAALAMALIENVQRRDLNAIEEAHAMQRLIDEFHLTHQEVAEAVGKSRTVVTNLIRLLRLNSEVRQMVESGELEMGHARALLSLDEELQLELALKIIKQDLSVRETEQLIRSTHEQKQQQVKSRAQAADPNIKRLERDISDKLNAHVSLQHSSDGKGKLVIQYNSLDELDGVLTILDIHA